MERRDCHTYRAAAQTAQVLAARRELTAQEEPMRRWSHEIPAPTASCPCPRPEADGERLDRVLEELRCQSQLLVDLLGAVNALTAALLARGGKV